jgi:hypothetical protein
MFHCQCDHATRLASVGTTENLRNVVYASGRVQAEFLTTNLTTKRADDDQFRRTSVEIKASFSL